MLQTWVHRIKPGREERLRAWLAELNFRADEVRDSFSAAGVRAEQAFLLPGESGWLLIYVSEAADHVHAAKVFMASTLPIDLEHRERMADCIEETLSEPLAYDVFS